MLCGGGGGPIGGLMYWFMQEPWPCDPGPGPGVMPGGWVIGLYMARQSWEGPLWSRPRCDDTSLYEEQPDGARLQTRRWIYSLEDRRHDSRLTCSEFTWTLHGL